VQKFELSPKETITLTIQYDLVKRMSICFILKDRLDNTVWQYFPDSLLTAKVDTNSPCALSTKRIVATFLWSIIRPNKTYTGLCSWTMTRWHASCITCRIRRVYRLELPKLFQVAVYTLYMDMQVNKQKLKRFMLKKACTVAEAFAIR
jgi:hypothetical protein